MEVKNEVVYFNILKFLGSIFIAIGYHYYCFMCFLNIENPYPYNGGAILYNLSVHGFVFVEMFFIISGILFSFAYKKKIETGMKFDYFFSKRIIRLFPLMIITNVFMFLGNCILKSINDTLWINGTVNIMDLCIDVLFGSQGVFNHELTLNGPTWYISVLMLCYILAFILTKLSVRLQTNYLYVIPIVIGVMIYSGIYFNLWNMYVARGFCSFFIGIIIGILMKKLDNISNNIYIYIYIK